MFNVLKKYLVFLLVSQVCFLGQVNALEVVEENDLINNNEVILDDDNEIEEEYLGYQVFLNDEEINEYKLDGLSEVMVRQEYDGELDEYTFNFDKEFNINYVNHLYGEYNYSFFVFYYEEEIDSKDISISYIGDNNSIINTNGVYYKGKTYYILGSVDKNYTVLDILSMFNQNLSDYGASLVVVDKEDNILLDTDIVSSEDKLKLSASYIEYGNKNDIVDYFDIEIIGDINNDGVIDNLDIKSMMVNDIINSSDSIFDMDDITNVEIEDEIIPVDKLNNEIEYEKEVYVDDYVEVKYYLDGFKEDILSSVVGKINYDRDILKLEDIVIDSVYGTYNDNGSFLYILDNYNKNGLFITFKFKALVVGSSIISLDDIKFMTMGGEYIEVSDALFSDNISIIEYGKGGDVELEDNEDLKEEEVDEKIEEETKEEIINDNVDNEVIYLEKVEVDNSVEVYEELLPSMGVQNISLSSDNYIKSLRIDGYDIDFDKDVYEYNIEVLNDVLKLDFDIELSDKDSFYKIIGNESFEVGNNEVVIVVTALDGSTRNYVINVEKKGNILEEEIENEKDTSRNIIIVLIIFVIIGLIYIIFRDEEENTQLKVFCCKQ